MLAKPLSRINVLPAPTSRHIQAHLIALRIGQDFFAKESSQSVTRSAKVEADGAVRLSYRLVSTKRCYSVAEARTIAQEVHQLSTSRDATVRIEFTRANP